MNRGFHSFAASSDPVCVMSKNTSELSDRDFMLLALDEARKCVTEQGRPRPRVGVVAARSGTLLGSAYRGEFPSAASMPHGGATAP